ncbi:Outward-rectifier potassium channel TOK1 channel YORK [Pyrenophora teres f. maculata]|nr:Outward-rectifier potassium channel TOK1 channel YORK [Pyrenophora teres f. maculata]
MMQHEQDDLNQPHGSKYVTQSEADHPGPSSSAKENSKKRWWNTWKKWEGEESDWWFASTGIPLLAATLGPLANVSSIAALVTPWRQSNIINGENLTDFNGVPFDDPRWCYWINLVSLVCGFLGNLFLLLNFTQRIRYVIALPATVILWYLSSGFLIAITICMRVYVPPIRPEQGYTQGFWYAIAAAAFYTICSMILMINMLGYFLGHYPENFALSESQRTLILQTMAFFIWLGGGAAVFAKLEQNAGNESWRFADALYFCDVTILTVGFGDLVPTTDVTRVSSLYTAVRELGDEKIVQKHIDRMRSRVVERTVSNSIDLRHQEHESHHLIRRRKLGFLDIPQPTQPRPFRTPMGESIQRRSTFPRVTNALRITSKPPTMLLKEEKDRFEAMRKIQADSKKFKRWMALFWSVTTFSILWCVGAVVFWVAEKDTQGMTYFQALYFCYVSLLTIGYGDLAPKSNGGRCFFVIWSLIAVPTMTILVSDLGDTVVANFKRWSDEVADFTVLPKAGIWRSFLDKHPWLLYWLQRWTERRARKRRLKKGFSVADPRETDAARSTSSLAHRGTSPNRPEDPGERGVETDIELTQYPTIEALAEEVKADTSKTPDRASLSRRLALSIQKVSKDLKIARKRYTYEEWVEFTRLIRMTDPERLDRNLGTASGATEDDNQEEGLVNWDWIGDDSPMVSGVSESEWLMERLIESLVRLEKRKEIARDRADMGALREMEGRYDGRNDIGRGVEGSVVRDVDGGQVGTSE